MRVGQLADRIVVAQAARCTSALGPELERQRRQVQRRGEFVLEPERVERGQPGLWRLHFSFSRALRGSFCFKAFLPTADHPSELVGFF